MKIPMKSDQHWRNTQISTAIKKEFRISFLHAVLQTYILFKKKTKENSYFKENYLATCVGFF